MTTILIPLMDKDYETSYVEIDGPPADSPGIDFANAVALFLIKKHEWKEVLGLPGAPVHALRAFLELNRFEGSYKFRVDRHDALYCLEQYTIKPPACPPLSEEDIDVYRTLLIARSKAKDALDRNKRDREDREVISSSLGEYPPYLSEDLNTLRGEYLGEDYVDKIKRTKKADQRRS